MAVDIESPLALPCGVVLKNRLCKAALTEGIADPLNRANPRLSNLYSRWGAGGSGLLITGNVQVDRRYLERPGNMAVDGNGGLDALADLARAGSAGGAQVWMQINHPGRQTPIYLNPHPVAPSAVPLAFDDFNGIRFGAPRALTGAEVEDIVRRFAHVAAAARACGFTGVQVHAAHGYLLSEFLSPLANQRTDRWGGPLENRARLLLEVVRAVRAVVGPALAVSVKLNSSDFQKGGFSHEDCLRVVGWLDEAGVDLLELSGGNYEQPSMGGAESDTDVLPVKASTRAREAYFLAYAESVRRAVRNTPLMVTGGFRSRAAMDAALAEGAADVIGLGRPLCSDSDIPGALLDRSAAACDDSDGALKVGTSIGYYYMQITRLADDAALYAVADSEQAQRDLSEHELARAAGLVGRDLAAATS
jgi:2,4-dienoyl-CoA reductase-like NADH-dependent reductase (Old Yellow Enzyme family)